MQYEIEKTEHTKTGEDIWVVRFKDHIEKSDWRAHAAKVRGIGGAYSRFTKGFNFSFDPLDAMSAEFGETGSNTRSTEGSTSKGYAIKKGKINKNSKHIHYIKKHVKDATVYHLGYDEPVPYSDNDPVDASAVVKELESKDYDRLWYDGNGKFSLRIHSNFHYNFSVEGMVDQAKPEVNGLNKHNFYVPIKKKPQFGNDGGDWGFYSKDEAPKEDYKEGDKVFIVSYGYARVGEITKVLTGSYTTSLMDFGESSFSKKEVHPTIHFDVKTLDGVVETKVDPEKIKPYSDGIAIGFDYIDIDKNVVSGLFYNGTLKQHPFNVWSKFIELPGTLNHYTEKQRRARKQENKNSYAKSHAAYLHRLEILKQAWFNWELSYPVNFAFARTISGETIEEQKSRIETWAKNNKWGVKYPEQTESKPEPEKQPKTSVDQGKEKLKPDKETYYTPNIVQTFINDHARNKEIEKLIDHIVNNDIQASDEEKEFLNKYSGSGGLQKQGAEGKGIMTEYYTPDEVVQKMWDLAYMHGFKDGGCILENSVGTGRFLQYAPANSHVNAFEINRYSYLITKILYPSVNVRNIPYENNFIDGANFSVKDNVTPQYDLVIGNPPYGTFNSEHSNTEKKYTRAANLTEYFITRSLDELKSGGILVYIIGSAVENGGVPFLSSGKTQCKELITKKAKLVDAYRLGNKIFKYTSVLADMVVFQKR